MTGVDAGRAGRARRPQVQAIYLDPASRRGFVAIDGEGVPVEPAVAEIIPGLARLMMPVESPQSQASPPSAPRTPRADGAGAS